MALARIPEFLAEDFSSIGSGTVLEALGPLPWDMSQFDAATMQTSGDSLNDLFLEDLVHAPEFLSGHGRVVSANDAYLNQLSNRARKNGALQARPMPSGMATDTPHIEAPQILANFGDAIGGRLGYGEQDLWFSLGESLASGGVHPIDYVFPMDYSSISPDGFSSSLMPASPVYSHGSASIPQPSPRLFSLTTGHVDEEIPAGDSLSTSLESAGPPGQFRTMLLNSPEAPKVTAAPAKAPPFTPNKAPSSRNGGLTFIHEFSGTRAVQTVGPTRTPKRGRRTGPLDTSQRLGARKVRNERIVCIRCRKDKQTVSPGARLPFAWHKPNMRQCDGFPCSRCLHVDTRSKQPCTKAHFQGIIDSGTCNYICEFPVGHEMRFCERLPNTSSSSTTSTQPPDPRQEAPGPHGTSRRHRRRQDAVRP